jgi:hypothetical protein
MRFLRTSVDRTGTLVRKKAGSDRLMRFLRTSVDKTGTLVRKNARGRARFCVWGGYGVRLARASLKVGDGRMTSAARSGSGK